MYDPEATIQDDDILQARYEQEGRGLARDKARGVCNHGWRQGVPDPSAGFPALTLEAINESRERGDFPDRPTERVPVAGETVCLDCGVILADEDALQRLDDEAYAAAMESR